MGQRLGLPASTRFPDQGLVASPWNDYKPRDAMRVLVVQRVRGIAGSENYLFQILPGLIKAGVEVSFLMLTKRHEQEVNRVFVERVRGFGVPLQEVHFGGRDNLSLV